MYKSKNEKVKKEKKIVTNSTKLVIGVLCNDCYNENSYLIFYVFIILNLA